MDIHRLNSNLLERKGKITNSQGMHARPAAKFAEIANKYKSEIIIKAKNKTIDGKSIIDLLTLGAEKGTEIIIIANGPDAAEALGVLEGLVKNNFNEDF
ncbi:MAG TPA: HPr family phosphocarrier protein [Candidatus Brocadiaceae bacterium]